MRLLSETQIYICVCVCMCIYVNVCIYEILLESDDNQVSELILDSDMMICSIMCEL